MTRDEILNMPAGREMDALIAEKVMGWFWKTEGYTRLGFMEGDRFRYGVVRGGGTADEYTSNLPNYSNDISAAWVVVRKHPHYFSLVRSNETGWRPAPWGAMLWLCRFYAPGKFEAKAETAPLAICRAALLAIMEYE
jgi:hypothetical protein